MEDLSLYVSRMMQVRSEDDGINWKAMNIPKPKSEQKCLFTKVAIDLSKVTGIVESEYFNGEIAVRVEFDLGEPMTIADTFDNVFNAWQDYKLSLNEMIFIDEEGNELAQEGDIEL